MDLQATISVSKVSVGQYKVLVCHLPSTSNSMYRCTPQFVRDL